jgi:hypothetical protein
MSMGTPEPALRHWNFAGQRGGGGFFISFFVVSASMAGKPGRAGVVPAS